MSDALDQRLQRLKRERDEADRLYNEALTALDRALPAAAALPVPPAPYDEQLITPLNEAWNIIPDAPVRPGLKGRMASFVWRVVAPYFQRQLTFNSRVVDHINRNVAAHREASRAMESIIAAQAGHIASLATFHAHLMVYLQQITGYVDTKDREMASGALVLNASLSAMAEDLAKRWESMTAREHRYEARTSAIAAQQEQLRAVIGVSQQAVQALKREVERLLAATAAPANRPGRDIGPTQRVPESLASGDGTDAAFARAVDAYKYVGFEDRFRGPREEIRERFESYVPFFADATDVLDVGCGRGEFLDLLAAHGIRARGIDPNHEMVEFCRARGHDVTESDAVAYLSSLPDGSLAGIFAAQVVEHLPPPYLLRFLELASVKLRSGGRLVLETLNPACWLAFFESYIRDITHVWPLHPETLQYFVLASGFSKAIIEYRSPVPADQRLRLMDIPQGADRFVVDLAEALNGNIATLNARLFTWMDYAVVGDR